MKTLIVSLIVALYLITPAYAEDMDEYAQASGIYAVEDSLDEDAKKISGRFYPDGSYDTNGALSRLIGSIKAEVRQELSLNMSYVSGLLAVTILYTLSNSLCSSESIKKYINLACCGAAAMVMLNGVQSLTEQTVDALNTLSDYSKAVLPALYTVAAASGAVSSSAAKYAAASLSISVLMNAAQKLIIPCVYAFVAASVSSSLFFNSILSSMAKFCKWAATTVMTALTLAFSTYIGMTGLVTGSVDAAAVKTAKTVISTTLPVVGGIISDSASTVLSAAGVIKSSAGVFCLIAVCAVCAGPFAALSVKMLSFKVVSAISDTVPNGRLSALIGDIGSAMGLLLGLLGSCGIMLFVSVMAGMKVVAL